MKTICLLFVTVLTVINGMAQSCLPQGITFNWQSQIDNFQVNYPGCSHIEGNVTISPFDITNLNGLSVLTSIGGTLSIYNMSNLSGLENLTSIGEDLIIQNCDFLPNLSWLLGLTSVGNLWLRYNPNLTNLSGLENLNISGGLVWINDNGKLSDCAVLSICNYLNGSGTAWIENNAPGCNSPEEVATDCGVGIDENAISQNRLSIYPNPSSTTIYINTLRTGFLSISSLNGQQLIYHQYIENQATIDISTFPSGIYIVKLISNKEVELEKLIKE
jgi:hypothetical protein